MGAEGEQLVAVGSRHLESAQAFAQQYGIPRCYGSYEALAADPEVEAIYIATPNTLHYENCRLCLEQGKHVLCEKPFTISPEQAQQLYRLAEEKHLFLMERKQDIKWEILDADITGPSIPKMFGAHGQLVGDEKGMYPYETKEGIKIVSINLLMEDEEAPVVWRGPVIAGAVKQFWNEAVWGDVDYLFVDMPPGTGDVPLTVFQSLPVDGIVIVTSPQELVQMIVKKAFHMANMMHIPVLGLVENFSYLKCPDCGKKIALFGESNIDEVAHKEKII